MDVLFIDNHLIAVMKPAGLLTQPTHLSSMSLEEECKAWIKEQFGKQGNVFLHAVHRLDKDVSGIVLFARTSKALSRLNEAMREGKIQKFYTAFVEGHMPSSQGSLEHYLLHDDHYAKVVDQTVKGAKRSVLRYRVLTEYKTYSLVEIELITGRYHQIRAQFAHGGHPLLGDAKYGSTYPYQSIALHQGKMSFFHPVTKTAVTIDCPFPESWTDSLIK